jgi:hypothetical protein
LATAGRPKFVPEPTKSMLANPKQIICNIQRELLEQQAAIFSKIVALLAKQHDGTVPENLTPDRLEELEWEAEELTEEWEEVFDAGAGGLSPSKTEMQRLLG